MDRRALSRGVSFLIAAALLSAMGCRQAPAPVGDSGRFISMEFLERLRAGNVEEAWNVTSTEFKSLMGLHSLKDLVKRHPALKVPAEYAESRPVKSNGRNMAEHIFHGTAKVRGRPSPSTIRVFVGADDGSIKVEKISVE